MTIQIEVVLQMNLKIIAGKMSFVFELSRICLGPDFNFSFSLVLVNLNFKTIENKERTHFTRVCKVYFADPMLHDMVLPSCRVHRRVMISSVHKDQ